MVPLELADFTGRDFRSSINVSFIVILVRRSALMDWVDRGRKVDLDLRRPRIAGQKSDRTVGARC